MALPVLAAYIPEALRARNAWVVWRMDERDGKTTKVPYACESAKRARSDDPGTWSSFTVALMTYSASPWDGMGYMLAGGDLTCIDLDHCIVDGIVEDWALTLAAKVGSYTEVSQSGEGLHIFVRGTPPKGRRRMGTVEMYGPEDNRYIAVTGRRLSHAGRYELPEFVRDCDLVKLHAELFPHEATAKGIESETERSNASPPITDDEVWSHASRAANAAKLAPLREEDWSGYGDDPSAARMALISILAFYTQDEDQLVRLCEDCGFDRDDDERKMRNHDIPHALSTLVETWHPAQTGTVTTGGIPISVAITAEDEIEDEIIADETRESETISFPFDALPDALSNLAIVGGRASGCVPESVAVHGLSVIAAAIGDTAEVLIGSWSQRPIVWTAIVARPGSAKSTALNLAKAPLEKADAAAAQHARDMSSGSDSKIVATPRRTLADDATAEKLALMLQVHPRGLLVAADELSGIVSGMNQYKGGKGNDRQLYLKLWSGAALRVDRISRDPIYVASPVCSVTGSIQPDVAHLLRGNDGMTGRWLTAYLQARGRTIPTDEVFDAQKKAWSALISSLLARSGQHEYALEPSAYRVYKAWRDDAINRQNAEHNDEVADYLGKLESHAARLVITLHVAGDPSGNEDRITAATVERALRVLRYFEASAVSAIQRTAIDPMRKAWDRPVDAAVEKLRDWFARNPTASMNDARRAHAGGARSAETFGVLRAQYEAVYGAHRVAKS